MLPLAYAGRALAAAVKTYEVKITAVDYTAVKMSTLISASVKRICPLLSLSPLILRDMAGSIKSGHKRCVQTPLRPSRRSVR